MKVVLASKNKHKLVEISKITEKFDMELVLQSELGVDILSLSAHKFYGPKGCGALYIRSGVKIERFIGGGEQERGLRGGTTNVPAVVGLAEALKAREAELALINEKVKLLSGTFLEGIRDLEGVQINGEGEIIIATDEGKFKRVISSQIETSKRYKKGSIIVGMREGAGNTELLYKLDLRGVSVAAGSACASASVKPSHVLLAMGLTEQETKESVRVSFGKENTETEVREAAEIFKATVNELRRF